MRIWPDCIPCILKMSLETAHLVMKDEGQVRRFMKQILKLKYFRGEDWRVTSPEIIKNVWLKLLEISGEVDPMKEIKKEQNSRALEIFPVARKSVLKSHDPLLAAIKLSIAGNAIDAMTEVRGETTQKVLERWSKFEIDVENLNRLKERLKKTRKLVYLGDNCGEIIFDKFLIEVLHEMYNLDTTFVTRTLPIMNDATLQDALSVGIGQVAQIMENGVHEPLPGTIPKKISRELKAKIEASDLIISKGGGNYDSLTEEKGLKEKVSFLLLAKCHPYCSIHQVSLNAPIIYNF
jgi:damage-control phosphatase, subfamily I